MITELTITIIVFSILILLNAIPKYGILVSNVALLVLFMFAYPNIDPKIGGFYSIMALGVFIFAILGFGTQDTSKIKIGTMNIKGFDVPVFELIFGIVLFMFMQFLSYKSTGSIIGVPQSLAITGIASQFSSALIMSLGFLENRFFLGLYLFYKKFLYKFVVSAVQITVAASIIGVAFVGLLFGLFHLTAYGGSVSGITFAFIIMSVWILSYEFIGEMPSSISHGIWNATVSLSKSLRVL